MGKGSKKESTKRYWTLSIPLILLSLMLTGCSGSVNAGTTPSYRFHTEAKLFGTPAGVSWFNGIEVKDAVVTVSPLIQEYDLPDNCGFTKAHEEQTPEMCSRFFCRITANSGDISDIRPVFIGDKTGHHIIRNGISYDTSGLKLLDGWYLFYVPNGTPDLSVVVANIVFSDGVMVKANQGIKAKETENDGQPQEGSAEEETAEEETGTEEIPSENGTEDLEEQK